MLSFSLVLSSPSIRLDPTRPDPTQLSPTIPATCFNSDDTFGQHYCFHWSIPLYQSIFASPRKLESLQSLGMQITLKCLHTGDKTNAMTMPRHCHQRHCLSCPQLKTALAEAEAGRIAFTTVPYFNTHPCTSPQAQIQGQICLLHPSSI